MDEREGRSNTYSTYGQTYSSEPETDELKMVRNYINSRNFREALNTLMRIQDRNAMWYYYSAVANLGVGNNVVALQHAKQAAVLEPNNMEYRNFANELQLRSQQYQNRGYGYGRQSFGTGNLCCDLWCMDTMCECMGGDLCGCM